MPHYNMKEHPEYPNLLQFESLNKQSGIEHFFTTRKGGVSKGSFSSLNLGNFSDDCPMDIYENRHILSRMWYMDIDDFIVPHQTHSNNVLVIDEEFMKSSPSEKINILYGVDATITQLKDIFLCATTADCVPVLLYDTKKQVAAAIHAGWKSIVGGILEKTIAKMREVYNSDPSDIVAAIGPSISQKNYEVGRDFIAAFIDVGFDLRYSVYVNHESNKWHVNLRYIVHNELERLGISSKQIEVSLLCTFDESDLFFSARRQSIVSGRMLSGIKLID